MEEEEKKTVNGIRGLVNTRVLGTIFLNLEDDSGELHHLTFNNFFYSPSKSKLLISPQTWARDRGDTKSDMKVPTSR